MASTVSIAALRQELWQKELYADVIDGMYFTKNKLMGKGDNVVAELKDQLKKDKGDTVTFGLSAKLSGSGVVGDGTLEAHEEAMNSYSQSVAIDQVRNAVLLTGKLDEQKVAYDMRKDAKNKLSIWAQEFLERQIFMKMGGLNSTDLTDTNSVVYSARAAWSNTGANPEADATRYLCAASSLAALTSSKILTTALISQAKVKAKLASPTIRPLRIEGKDYYVMFIHPNQAYDLRNASGSVWAQAMREAQIRGDKNPLFTGALGVWDGVILFEHEYVTTAQAAKKFNSAGAAVASGRRGYRATLCGRQSVAVALTGAALKMVDKPFDYDNQQGYATGIIGGVQKATFNSKDYGVVTVDTDSSLT